MSAWWSHLPSLHTTCVCLRSNIWQEAHDGACCFASGSNAGLSSFISALQYNINYTVTLHTSDSRSSLSSPGSFTKRCVWMKLTPSPVVLADSPFMPDVDAGEGARCYSSSPRCCGTSSLSCQLANDSRGMVDLFRTRIHIQFPFIWCRLGLASPEMGGWQRWGHGHGHGALALYQKGVFGIGWGLDHSTQQPLDDLYGDTRCAMPIKDTPEKCTSTELWLAFASLHPCQLIGLARLSDIGLAMRKLGDAKKPINFLESKRPCPIF